MKNFAILKMKVWKFTNWVNRAGGTTTAMTAGRMLWARGSARPWATLSWICGSSISRSRWDKLDKLMTIYFHVPIIQKASAFIKIGKLKFSIGKLTFKAENLNLWILPDIHNGKCGFICQLLACEDWIYSLINFNKECPTDCPIDWLTN